MEVVNKDRERSVYKITIAGSAVNFLLLVFKFLAGILGRSAAIIADAVHSLSDFVTDIIVLIFIKVSNKPEDRDHQYGHGKFETLATALIGVILFIVGAGILWNGGKAIWTVIQGGTLEQPGMIALIAAVVSVVSKEVLYRYTVVVGKQVDSKAVIANAWHHRSDALSSIGTAIGIGGAILLGEKWRVLDPIAAVVVSFFIMKVAIELTGPSVRELMDGSLSQETEKKIHNILLQQSGVHEPHHLRTRRIGNVNAVEVHVRMDGDLTLTESHDKTVEMESELRKLLGGDAIITIHMEPKVQ